MSTLRLLNAQIGTSVTPSQNFTWYQPTVPDGSVRLGVGNSGATTKDMIKVSGSDIILDTPKAIATPPQFDNSKLLATTDFLQLSKGGFRTASDIIIANTTLTLADIGKIFSLEATTLTVGLPLASTVPAGNAFYVRKRRASNSTTTFTHNGSNILTVIPQEACTFVFISDGTGGYYINRLPEGGQGKSLSGNGYSIMDNGLILQWGKTFVSGSTRLLLFNMVFPNSCFSVVGNSFDLFADRNEAFVISGNVTTSGVTSFNNTSLGQAVDGDVYWQAIGY